MKLKRLPLLLLAVAAAATPAFAGFKVQLKAPEAQILRASNGIHAVDSRTERTLVRVIAPGLPVGRVGSVRVLVMNLGVQPFGFGPENVTMTLADGTVLVPLAHEKFDRSEQIVSREARMHNATRGRINSNLSGIATGGQTGQFGQTLSANSATAAASQRAASDLDVATDVDQARIDLLMNAIQDVMRPSRVAPMEAAGGYLVFELPKEIRKARLDQPLSLVVRAGPDTHRFDALLDRD